MTITEQVLVEVASVTVNDEYRVELTQFRKVTDYTPDQAERLAAELVREAGIARQVLQEHVDQVAARARSLPASEVL